MYGYKWIDGENGIFKLDVSVAVKKEIRPVFKEELDLFEMYKIWEYPDTSLPLLWAEGIRKYVLNGDIIAEARGGSYYEKPKIIIKNTKVKSLEPIDVDKLIEVNKDVMEGLVQRSINFIRKTYEDYCRKGYKFVTTFSGGKDSIVLLDLVQRALAPDQFYVVFGDTGMELSDTYKAVELAQRHYPNLNFSIAKSTFSANESWGLFGPPGRKMRWCCTVHKSVPTMLKLREMCSDGENVSALVFDGVRAEESERRSHYSELSNGKHINQINCSPIFNWNSAEVFIYILSRDILFNKAYRFGSNRVGCTICPLSSGWRDSICNHVYPEELKPLLEQVRQYGENMGVSAKSMKKYIAMGKWKSRAGGRGMKNGGNRVYEVFEDDKIAFNFTEYTQEWTDVARLLGPITERLDVNGEQVINGKTLTFNIDYSNGMKVSYGPKSNMDRYIISWLRGTANKVAYCAGCNTCVVECPTGAFSIDENRLISIDNSICVHCHKCITQVEKGCKLARCLSTTLGGSNMKFIGMNRYTTFGFRESFLEHFFDMGNECWSSKELGNLQYAALKVWLKEAEIIEVNPQTDKNGQITELGQKLMEIGIYNPFVWAVIWTNLSYNSSLIKWYLFCVDKGEVYEKGDLIFLIGDDYSERQRKNAVSSLCETLGKSPIGNTLEMGIPIPDGKTYKYYKKGWSTPDGAALLYAMYKYAESLEGHYSFTLKELQGIRDNRPENFIGMDPVTIFALDENAFKEMARQMANEYPDYIKIAFVADLDNITLNNEKNSLDVVNLVLGGNQNE